MKRTSTILLSFVLVFSSAACKRKVSVGGASYEKNGEQVKIETGNGSFVAGGNVKLPEGFPDDVPLPSDQIQVAMKMPQGFNVAFVCKGTPADVFTKLQGEFKAKGWEEVMAVQQESGSALSYKKDDNRHCQCSIGKNKEGQTLVNMIAQAR